MRKRCASVRKREEVTLAVLFLPLALEDRESSMFCSDAHDNKANIPASNSHRQSVTNGLNLAQGKNFFCFCYLFIYLFFTDNNNIQIYVRQSCAIFVRSNAFALIIARRWRSGFCVAMGERH